MNELFQAMKHLILGYSDEEKAARLKQLEESNKRAEENKNRNNGVYDPSEPVVEVITGIPGEMQNSSFFIFLAAAIVFILIIKK